MRTGRKYASKQAGTLRKKERSIHHDKWKDLVVSTINSKEEG